MTRPDDLEKIRQMLQRRRHDLADAQRGVDRELTAMQEADRDPEYEESAQTASAEYTLVTLHDNHQREIEQIDAALRRLDTGSYGLCVDCELDIPTDRLMAVPFSLRCADCAHAREARGNRGHPASM